MTVRVLVVDDDFRVAAVHAAVAARVEGCEVVGQAVNLAQARAWLDGSVDLVLADEFLPDGAGSDLIGASSAAVLMVTAADDAETVRRALLKGAVGYVVKPFGLRVLEERIADFVVFHDALPRQGRLAQDRIDAHLRQLRPRTAAVAPKGRSAVTASAVSDLLREAPEPLTALAVAETIGVSRATAQRYLADLVSSGEVTLGLRYGVAGRPEHSYSWSR